MSDFRNIKLKNLINYIILNLPPIKKFYINLYLSKKFLFLFL